MYETPIADDIHDAMERYREGSDDHFYGAWQGGSKAAGGHAVGGGKGGGSSNVKWPAPDLSKAGIEDATSAWSGIHFADIRDFMRTGRVMPGRSDKADPLHGISRGRLGQSVSTLTALVANGRVTPGLYRGLNTSAAVAAKFRDLKPGQSLGMSLSAWSADHAQATRFTTFGRGTQPIMLRLESGGLGYDMARHSHYPKEREWITNGKFTVSSVEPGKAGQPLTVTLRQQAVYTTPADMGGQS